MPGTVGIHSSCKLNWSCPLWYDFKEILVKKKTEKPHTWLDIRNFYINYFLE